MNKKTVVIIGAGFYGILLANKLIRQSKGEYNVKLLTKVDYTYFLPSSIRVSVDNDTKGTIIPLKDCLEEGIEVVLGESTLFDEEKVTLENGDILEFDYLVVATGAKWSDPIRTSYDLGDNYKEYFAKEHEKFERAKTIVLIGGGYNNAELAGELHDKYGSEMKKGEKRIVVVHSKDKMLPDNGFYGDKLRQRVTDFFTKETNIEVMLNARAQISEKDPNKVLLGKDQSIDADYVVSSIGVVPSVPPHQLIDIVDSNGFVKVEDTLLVKGLSKRKIFAIGDVTDFDYKGLIYRGNWVSCVANNIGILLASPNADSTRLYRAKRPSWNVPALVSMGKYAGCGQYCLPVIGTFLLPDWIARKKKSGNLYREKAVSLLKWG